MLTLEQISKRLKDRNLAEVARQTGVSHVTVWKASTGRYGLSYSTVLTLSEYLEKHQ